VWHSVGYVICRLSMSKCVGLSLSLSQLECRRVSMVDDTDVEMLLLLLVLVLLLLCSFRVSPREPWPFF